jgi:cobalt transporter subunit CbtB
MVALRQLRQQAAEPASSRGIPADDPGEIDAGEFDSAKGPWTGYSILPKEKFMQITETVQPISAKTVSVGVQAALAMAFGLFIVAMVGFAPIEVVHNAAHDVRHSSGFPCH